MRSNLPELLVHLEGRIERMDERLAKFAKVVAFYELAKSSPEARDTGAMRDATEWLLEEAVALSKVRV